MPVGLNMLSYELTFTDLAGNEKVLPLHNTFIKFCFDAFPHLFLILVHMRSINVPIASINSCLNCFGYFPWFGLENNKHIPDEVYEQCHKIQTTMSCTSSEKVTTERGNAKILAVWMYDT